jgi:glycosyltransferase involved in cell wall biosynthesis
LKTINLYFRVRPQGYKIFPGDRYLLNCFRRLSGKNKVSGLERVFINLCSSFDDLNIKYTVNKPFKSVKPDEPIVILGVGRYSLEEYDQPNPIIAGIGLMTHPNEWPQLFKEYPVVKYLQHSEWTNDLYAKHFGPKNCAIWPAGVDTIKWKPHNTLKEIDFLVYKKIMWDKQAAESTLYQPILNKLTAAGYTYREITYGQYTEQDYLQLLRQSRAMIFLCEHESQGFACCEAMSMNVPVLAWDQGFWLDPNRFNWGETDVPASSVPFFDDTCGAKFKDLPEFEIRLPLFWQQVKGNAFAPRTFVEQNLSFRKSAERMLEIINSVYS